MSEVPPRETEVSRPPNRLRLILGKPFAAWVIILAALFATAAAWRLIDRSARASARLRFENSAEVMESLISSRMQRYQDVLAAGAGFFAAKQKVTRDEWREFVHVSKIGERLPGIQGLGFAQRVAFDRLEDHLATVQREGFPNYHILPEGPRSEYFPVVYLEPFEGRNLRAFGYDMFSETRRRSAMERARDTGTPAFTEAVTLVQEVGTNVQKGFLAYHPIYRNGQHHQSVEARRTNLVGFVYSPFRVTDLMWGILGAGDRDVHFRIYDGNETRADSLLYDCETSNDLRNASATYSPDFTKESRLNLGGHVWTIHCWSRPGFLADATQNQPTVVAFVGLGLVALLFMTFVSMLGEKNRALKLAEVMRTGAQSNLERAELALRELDVQRRNADRANQAKGEFLAKMSHEIRTPMNGVIGLTELLLETRMSTQQRSYAESIRSSADNLLLIINDILDLSKIEAGKLEVECVDFDLHEAVEGVVELLANGARKKEVHLTCQIAPGVPGALRGDCRRLKQILTNLVGNAMKFTSRGEVTVRVSRESCLEGEETVRFEVRDTGPGIPLAVQGRLFAPFAQGDTEVSRKHGGTGLGLAISRQLVQLMKGSIGLNSVPNQGSTFWFTLPFRRQPTPIHTEFLLNRTPAAGRRLLIVDSNPATLAIVRELCASWGLLVDSAASAEEALSRLKGAASQNDPYQWALIDRHLNDLDALLLARRVKAERIHEQSHLILMTPPDEQLDERTLEAAGINGMIMKPIRRRKLQELLIELEQSEWRGRGLVAHAGPDPIELGDSHPRGELRILLVEDHPVNQKVAIGKLLQMGYEAYPCANGVEALKALERIPYDVVLMDCEMPEMDGYAATREIRRRTLERPRLGEPAQAVYIVAMTADAMTGTRERCFQAGMNDYVSKPVTTAELKAALDRAIAHLESVRGPFRPPGEAAVLEEGMLEELRPLRAGNGDSQFLALVDMFLEDTPKLLADLNRAMIGGDTAEVVAIAHKLKSAAGYFGARQMSVTCHQLKELGRSGKAEFGVGLLHRLDREFNLVRMKLTEERARFDGNETHRAA